MKNNEMDCGWKFHKLNRNVISLNKLSISLFLMVLYLLDKYILNKVSKFSVNSFLRISMSVFFLLSLIILLGNLIQKKKINK